jgi:hypothetical protein
MISGAKQNIGIGLVFFGIAGAVLFETAGLSPHSRELPFLSAWAIIVFGVVLIIQTFINPPSPEKAAVKPFAVFDTAVIGLALLVTAGVIPFLGFYSTILLFVWFVFHFYSSTFRVKDLPKGLVFSLAIMGFLYLVFGLFMKLPVPQGLLP